MAAIGHLVSDRWAAFSKLSWTCESADAALDSEEGATDMAREILAGDAVKMLLPLLDKVGKGAPSDLGERADENGRKLLLWLRSMLDDQGKQVLNRFEADPASRAKQRRLRLRIARLLEGNPELIRELEALTTAGLKTAQQVMHRRRAHRGQQEQRQQQVQEQQEQRQQQEQDQQAQGEWRGSSAAEQSGSQQGSNLGMGHTGQGSGGGRDD